MNPRTLQSFSGPVRSSGTQMNYKICPVCGSQSWKLYVDPNTGKWYCFAGAHSAGGCVDVGVPASPGAAIREKLGDPGRTESHWPEVQMPSNIPLSNMATRYLTNRGLSHSLHLYREMQDEPRILIPYRGRAGEWIYWNSRAYMPNHDGPKYKAASGRHPLYVLPRWESKNHVIIVEGAFDAACVRQVVESDTVVVAVGGKSLPRYLMADLMQIATGAVTIMLDADALDSALSMRQRISPFRITKLKTLPEGKDPADMDLSRLRGIIYG